MLAASTAPSAAPAPTSMCISSMNRMQLPALLSSSMTFFRRSSNSPRYFVPATRLPMSRVTMRRPCSISGTSPLMMRWASASTMAVLPTPGSPMSTGLFLVRRERICTTRSISCSRPTTGSSLLARAAAVRSIPSWSTVGVRVARATALGGALRHALRQDAGDLGAHLLQAHAQALQHAGGDALALAHEAQEQVLRADVVVAQAAGLVHGQLDDLLGTRRQADLADHSAVAAADDELDGGADLVQLHAEVGQHLGRHPFALPDQTEEKVLRADVVVVEAQSLLLGEGQDPDAPSL